MRGTIGECGVSLAFLVHHAWASVRHQHSETAWLIKLKFCRASLGSCIEILFAISWPPSMVKNFKNLQNGWTDFHETWYVASGTPAHHSLKVARWRQIMKACN